MSDKISRRSFIKRVTAFTAMVWGASLVDVDPPEPVPLNVGVDPAARESQAVATVGVIGTLDCPYVLHDYYADKLAELTPDCKFESRSIVWDAQSV